MSLSARLCRDSSSCWDAARQHYSAPAVEAAALAALSKLTDKTTTALCHARHPEQVLLACRDHSSCWDAARQHYPAPAVEATAALLSLSKLFLYIAGFWALFDQHASTWIVQVCPCLILTLRLLSSQACLGLKCKRPTSLPRASMGCSSNGR